MARIILEHEDVGAWRPINSSFLTTRYYELDKGGDGTLQTKPAGNSHFATDTVPNLQYNDDRRRGVLFQLGTFEEDEGHVHDAAAGNPGSPEHKGSHTDFDSIVIKPASGAAVTLKRGDVFWLNVKDEALGHFPMNAFHALYFWPAMFFRGPAYRGWRDSNPTSNPKYARCFQDKRLHPRLRLDSKVNRPNGKTGPHGALLTYWNGGSPWTITTEHQIDPRWGAPWYQRHTLETAGTFQVAVYGSIKRIEHPDAAGQPKEMEAEVLDLVRKSPKDTYDEVEEIRVRATPWTGAWTHGGLHDDPWTKP
jgi:hypothetical protein